MYNPRHVDPGGALSKSYGALSTTWYVSATYLTPTLPTNTANNAFARDLRYNFKCWDKITSLTCIRWRRQKRFDVRIIRYIMWIQIEFTIMIYKLITIIYVNLNLFEWYNDLTRARSLHSLTSLHIPVVYSSHVYFCCCWLISVK